MDEAIPLIIILVLIASIALFTMSDSFPLMEVDSVTHECVRILPPEAGTCDNPPERYAIIYVAPEWMRRGCK